MSFFSRLLKSSAAPVRSPAVEYVLPAEWKPAAQMKRIILHWTGGSYVASSLDKACYHFLIEGDLDVIRGRHSIAANNFIAGKTSDDYAAHTKGTNTGSIGVSICSMAGATEKPFKAGKYPLTEEQWQCAAEVIAHLARHYGIAVTDKTVLTHAEVQPNLGIQQNGKWDMNRLPFAPGIIGYKACGDDLRRRVRECLS